MRSSTTVFLFCFALILVSALGSETDQEPNLESAAEFDAPLTALESGAELTTEVGVDAEAGLEADRWWRRRHHHRPAAVHRPVHRHHHHARRHHHHARRHHHRPRHHGRRHHRRHGRRHRARRHRARRHRGRRHRRHARRHPWRRPSFGRPAPIRRHVHRPVPRRVSMNRPPHPMFRHIPKPSYPETKAQRQARHVNNRQAKKEIKQYKKKMVRQLKKGNRQAKAIAKVTAQLKKQAQIAKKAEKKIMKAAKKQEKKVAQKATRTLDLHKKIASYRKLTGQKAANARIAVNNFANEIAQIRKETTETERAFAAAQALARDHTTNVGKQLYKEWLIKNGVKSTIPHFQKEADGSAPKLDTLELGKEIKPESHGIGLIQKSFSDKFKLIQGAADHATFLYNNRNAIKEEVKMIEESFADSGPLKVPADLKGNLAFVETKSEALPALRPFVPKTTCRKGDDGQRCRNYNSCKNGRFAQKCRDAMNECQFGPKGDRCRTRALKTYGTCERGPKGKKCRTVRRHMRRGTYANPFDFHRSNEKHRKEYARRHASSEIMRAYREALESKRGRPGSIERKEYEENLRSLKKDVEDAIRGEDMSDEDVEMQLDKTLRRVQTREDHEDDLAIRRVLKSKHNVDVDINADLKEISSVDQFNSDKDFKHHDRLIDDDDLDFAPKRKRNRTRRVKPTNGTNSTTPTNKTALFEVAFAEARQQAMTELFEDNKATAKAEAEFASGMTTPLESLALTEAGADSKVERRRWWFRPRPHHARHHHRPSPARHHHHHRRRPGPIRRAFRRIFGRRRRHRHRHQHRHRPRPRHHHPRRPMTRRQRKAARKARKLRRRQARKAQRQARRNYKRQVKQARKQEKKAIKLQALKHKPISTRVIRKQQLQHAVKAAGGNKKLQALIKQAHHKSASPALKAAAASAIKQAEKIHQQKVAATKANDEALKAQAEKAKDDKTYVEELLHTHQENKVEEYKTREIIEGATKADAVAKDVSAIIEKI